MVLIFLGEENHGPKRKTTNHCGLHIVFATGVMQGGWMKLNHVRDARYVLLRGKRVAVQRTILSIHSDYCEHLQALAYTET